MTFEKLNLQYDMMYLFRRIEKNLRVGKVDPERVRQWAKDTAKAAVPPTHPKAEEYLNAITDHCGRWIDYLVKNPVAAENNEFLPNERVEQLRLKL